MIRNAESPDTVDAVRVHLLGGFRVACGSREIPAPRWRLRKAQHLVKLLALAPDRRLDRDQALDLLWPDLTPEAAANNLRFALHVARRLMEPVLAATAPPVELHLRGDWITLWPADRVWTDVAAFEAAAAAARRRQEVAAYQVAVSLYGGDLLPEDRYEDWPASRREELRQSYLALLLELAVLQAAGGDADGAIATLQRAVAHDPAHEAAHAALLRLYALTGQRLQALRQYQRLRAALRTELDIDPDPTTQQLYLQILTGRLVGPPPPAAAAHQTGDGREAAGARLSNLLSPLTRFIGREDEVAALRRLLAPSADDPEAARLVTLTGAGGCGKTRLALEVAAGLLDAYADGVWLVELGPLADPSLVPQALAAALGVREEPGRPLAATLADALRPRHALLLLDNCEHLVDACAALAEAVLRAATGVRILATGRQSLGVGGECVWRVAPLPLPESGAPLSLPNAARSDAVRLFVDRATLSRPGFELAEDNAGHVVQICRRLDGLPLAIELAAARVAVLPVAQLAARLDDRFRLLIRLLTGGGRTAPERHQALQAAVDWSYDLLTPTERALFRRLSVFTGGWTLDAAEAACSSQCALGGSPPPPGGVGGKLPTAYSELPTDQVLDLLASLVDKSLVVVDDIGGEARYRLLETLREYAARRLAESGEAAAIRRRHAVHYLALAERAAPELKGPDEGTWLRRLEAEHDNLRAALAWAVESGAGDGENEMALRLAGALWPYWDLHGENAEGRRWLDRVLRTSREAPTAARANALLGAGVLAWNQEDDAAARPLLEASLALARGLGDDRAIADALNALGDVARHQGRHAEARTRHQESLARCRALGDRVGAAAALRGLGDVARRLEDTATASACYEEALTLAQAHGDRRIAAWLLNGVALVAEARGDAARARARYEEALAAFREVGDRRGAAHALGSIGALDLQRGDPAAARTRYAEALAAFRELGGRRGICGALGGLAAAVAALGNAAAARTRFDEALSIGRGIGDRQAAAWLHFELADVARRLGDHAQARALYQQSVALHRALGNTRGAELALQGLAALPAPVR